MKSNRLRQYLGKKILLASFPAAESPVFTAEMGTLRDSLSKLGSYGLEIIGISVDGSFAYKMFVKRPDLNCPVLSDYKSYATTKEKQSANMALS